MVGQTQLINPVAVPSNDVSDPPVTTVIYVGKNGSDSNDGKHPDRAKLTIQNAIDASQTSGSVVVTDGETYSEALSIPWDRFTLDAPLAILSGSMTVTSDRASINLRTLRVLSSSPGIEWVKTAIDNEDAEHSLIVNVKSMESGFGSSAPLIKFDAPASVAFYYLVVSSESVVVERSTTPGSIFLLDGTDLDTPEDMGVMTVNVDYYRDSSGDANTFLDCVAGTIQINSGEVRMGASSIAYDTRSTAAVIQGFIGSLPAGLKDPTGLGTVSVFQPPNLTDNFVPMFDLATGLLVDSGLSDDGTYLNPNNRVIRFDTPSQVGASTITWMSNGGLARNLWRNVPLDGFHYLAVGNSSRLTVQAGRVRMPDGLLTVGSASTTGALNVRRSDVPQLVREADGTHSVKNRILTSGIDQEFHTGNQKYWYMIGSSQAHLALIASGNTTSFNLYDQDADANPNNTFNLYHGNSLIGRFGYLNGVGSPLYVSQQHATGPLILRSTGTGEVRLSPSNVNTIRASSTGLMFYNGTTPAPQPIFIAAATDAADLLTKFNQLLGQLQSIGLQAAS